MGKKEITEKLLEKVDKMHDWREGQTRSGGGTYLYRIDVCRICGLERHWESDRQNGIDSEYTFIDEHGLPLTLREAAARECP